MIRRRVVLRGVVQGVGFRPHVARLAKNFPITGFCGNDDESVFVEAQGEAAQVEEFLRRVVADAPALAFIEGQEGQDLPLLKVESDFVIVQSQRTPGAITLISPDVAICKDCLAELNDVGDRRYRYPFITCTNCGPRLSIIRDVPYDRPNTTMDIFQMCPACAAEYTDPENRRFHAQPISCFDCGPTLRLELAKEADWALSGGSPYIALWEDAITQARAMLADGQILAVKGIGGFTLFCDARNQPAVQLLRGRKRRPAKPFAVMVADLATAQSFANLGAEQLAELASSAHPIVLAPQSTSYDLADGVAPGLDDVGVMLAYAPIHQLLVRPGEVYVATSANGSGEPLTYEDGDALRLLSGIVDAFLTHDRTIYVPVEDSVVMGDGHDNLPIRRSRGYAPLPVRLGGEDASVLAVGGELKNTFAITRDGMAFLSAHIGDMGSLASQQAFEKSVNQMLSMHRRAPELVVADLHPDYATTGWAERYAALADIPLLQVQHHHAHALSLVAEQHLLDEPLLCAVFDGTGYGLDGTIWGGELLYLEADPMKWQRVWHLPELWLPGGDSAVWSPWKMAVALLAEFDIDGADLPPFQVAPIAELRLVQSQLFSQTGVIRTTSAGRWFDAISSLLGVTHRVSYEGQAAMELERTARLCKHTEHQHPIGLELPDLVKALVAGLRAGEMPACLSRRFHTEFAGVLTRALVEHSAQLGIKTLGWSGGVTANRQLSHLLSADIAKCGLQLHTHQVVPANDGGLSLGQALAGYLSLTGSNPNTTEDV